MAAIPDFPCFKSELLQHTKLNNKSKAIAWAL